jgi:hypothetical protein
MIQACRRGSDRADDGAAALEGTRMSTEARALQRIIRDSVRDMLDVYRLEARAGPVGDKALERVIFRAATPIVDRLAAFSGARRAALLPSIVRLLLASFRESVAGAEGTEEGDGAR